MFNVSYNPDVLSCLANLSSDEVFTPPELVNQMLDVLPPELFRDPTMTFLDPACKSGVFLREITKRLMDGIAEHIPDQQARVNHILTKQVFGIALTELTGYMSRRTVYCSKIANSSLSICTAFNSMQGNIVYKRTTHTWQNGRCSECGASQAEYDRHHELESYAYQFIHTPDSRQLFTTEGHPQMKFDVIIGNPPYQLSDGGAQASAIPIYHKFVEQAKKLNPRYLSMIIPSRWFSSGRGLDKFREEMLNDTRITILHDFLDASDCFPGVEIKGGVCYFLWNREFEGPCDVYTHSNGKLDSHARRYLLENNYNVFIRYNKALPILEKIHNFGETTIDTIISSQKPFGLRTFFKGQSNSFSNSVKVYANQTIGYISDNEIDTNKPWINTHKVIVPRAIGSGDGKTDRIKPIYAEPNSCCTETYIVFGPLSSKIECNNLITYIQTRFFHFLVTLQKITMMAPKNVYSFVPLQDFTEPWDDAKLYAKYGLTNEEISFIESMIWPQENSND